MQRGHDRHPQVTNQPDDVTAGRPAVDAVFMLDAHDIGVGEIEKIGGAQVRVDLLFFDFEACLRRILIARGDVVDRQHEAVGAWILSGDRRAEIIGESRDSALPRQIVADECDLLDVAISFHRWHESSRVRRLGFGWARRPGPTGCPSPGAGPADTRRPNLSSIRVERPAIGRAIVVAQCARERARPSPRQHSPSIVRLRIRLLRSAHVSTL